MGALIPFGGTALRCVTGPDTTEVGVRRCRSNMTWGQGDLDGDLGPRGTQRVKLLRWNPNKGWAGS